MWWFSEFAESGIFCYCFVIFLWWWCFWGLVLGAWFFAWLVIVLAFLSCGFFFVFLAFKTSAVYAYAGDFFIAMIVSRLNCFAIGFLYIQTEMNLRQI